MKKNRKVPVDKLRALPMQRTSLAPDLLAEARRLYETIGKFVRPTFEQWEHGFCCDWRPERELMIWANIEKCYLQYCDGKQLPEDERKCVVAILSLIATSDGDQLRAVLGAAELLRIWDATVGESYPLCVIKT